MAIIMNNYDRVRDELHDDPDDISMHMRRLLTKKFAGWFPALYKAFGLKEAQSDSKTLTLEDCTRIWANDSEALQSVGITCPESRTRRHSIDGPIAHRCAHNYPSPCPSFANEKLTGEKESDDGADGKQEEESVSQLLHKVSALLPCSSHAPATRHSCFGRRCWSARRSSSRSSSRYAACSAATPERREQLRHTSRFRAVI